MEKAALHTVLCAETTYRGITLEVRTGLEWALGDGKSILVYQNINRDRVRKYGGPDLLRQIEEYRYASYRQKRTFGDIEFSVVPVDRLGFASAFKLPEEIKQNSGDPKDLLVSCVYFVLLQASSSNSTKVVLPLISVVIEGNYLDLSAQCLLSLHAFLIFAQKHSTTSIKTVVFMVSTSLEVQHFLQSFLDLTDCFVSLTDYGSPSEQASMPGGGLCQTCMKPRFQFYESKCTFCVFRFQSGPIFCESCQQQRDDVFHNCRYFCRSCATSAGIQENDCVCLNPFS